MEGVREHVNTRAGELVSWRARGQAGFRLVLEEVCEVVGAREQVGG